MKEKKSIRKGEKATIVSASVSACLAVLKTAAGITSGSVALITSALDSFSDLAGMLASWFGFRISSRKPDQKFQYGYYKAESVATFIVSLMIIYAAMNLAYEGYSSLFASPSIEIPAFALSAAFVSVIVSLGLSRFLHREGNAINSELLITNSRERLADVASTSAVFIAVAMSYSGIPYAEGIVTILVSLLILRMGMLSVRDSVFALMDRSPSRSKEKRMQKIIDSEGGVEGFSDLKLRKAGMFIFGEVTINVGRDVSVRKGHQIADAIEKKAREKIKDLISFTVHVEPSSKKLMRLAVPVRDDKGMDSETAGRFGRASYFILADIDNGEVTNLKTIKNTFSSRKEKAGLSIANMLIRKKVDALLAKKLGEISFHTLRDHMVDIYEIRGGRAGDVIDDFRKGSLELMEEHS